MPRSQTPQQGLNLMAGRIRGLKPRRVLDVGAGDGLWSEVLEDRAFVLDALEVWEPNVRKYHLGQTYDGVFVLDMREFMGWRAYDAVILGDVLEHIPQAEAIGLVQRIRAAGCRVFLTIPITPCPQDGGAWGNPYETHHYDWTDKELREMGFVQIHAGLNPNGRVEIGCYEMGETKNAT